jgi:Flp pilus assembly protein CpaB
LGQTERRPLLPILLIAAGVIVLVAAIAGILLFSGGDQPADVSTSSQEIPFSQISRVDVATTKSALESGQAVVVDVRDKVYYEDGHIAGAVSIPISEIESRLGELDQSDWIILYCT